MSNIIELENCPELNFIENMTLQGDCTGGAFCVGLAGLQFEEPPGGALVDVV